MSPAYHKWQFVRHNKDSPINTASLFSTSLRRILQLLHEYSAAIVCTRFNTIPPSMTGEGEWYLKLDPNRWYWFSLFFFLSLSVLSNKVNILCLWGRTTRKFLICVHQTVLWFSDTKYKYAHLFTSSSTSHHHLIA